MSRGELNLLLTLPKPGSVLTVPATFVSERKVTCTLPPAPSAGIATVEPLFPMDEAAPSRPATRRAVAPRGRGRAASATTAAAPQAGCAQAQGRSAGARPCGSSGPASYTRTS